MKIIAYICIATAVLNLITALATISNPETAEYGARRIGGVLMFGVVGFYLLNRVSQKEKEKSDRDKWKNGNL